jgi:hypothetical protein
MTTLSEIRELEARLHSHILEWSDAPLQNELLYLLDDLQELHGELDKRDVPKTGADGLELSLRQRVFLLSSRPSPQQLALNLYGQTQASEPKQYNLF